MQDASYHIVWHATVEPLYSNNIPVEIEKGKSFKTSMVNTNGTTTIKITVMQS